MSDRGELRRPLTHGGVSTARLFAGTALFRYAELVDAGERWTEEAVLRESERWVHVPRDGTLIEDERRLLVHLQKRWGTSRVWRSWAADDEQAGDLIKDTIGEVRAAGGGRLVWHTGDRVSPPFMDECLARRGFQTAEQLDVLAFVLADDRGGRLPLSGAPEGVAAGLARDAEGLREAFRVHSEFFSSPPPDSEAHAEYAAELEKLRRLEHGESPGEGASLALRFVAFSDPEYGGNNARRAIAAAGAQLAGETLRLWGAGTRKAFRGRGAYSALVVE